MARPATAAKYHGKVCGACGTTLRYVANHACVVCTQIRNQTKYAARKNPALDRAVKVHNLMSHRHGGRPVQSFKVGAALVADANSMGAATRSKYLDSLILTPTQRQERPAACHGDARREAMAAAGLIGFKPASSTQPSNDEKRRHANAALVDAVAEILPALPDLAHPVDVLAALPDDMRATLAPRQYGGLSLVGLALKSLGVTRREIGNTLRKNARVVYVIRDPHGRYGRMKRNELEAAYTGRKVDERRGRPLTPAQRQRRYRAAKPSPTPGGAETSPMGTPAPAGEH